MFVDAKIDACFRDFTAKEELILYRGVESKEQLTTNIGYTSTSLSFTVARDFTKAFVAHITIPQGTKLKALRITSSEEFSNEDEVLFPCNTSFKIIDAPNPLPRTDYNLDNEGKCFWIPNPRIEIIFATLDQSPSKGGKNLKNKLRLCSTNKVYTIYGVSQDRYIRVKSQRVYLKSIQRQYRFV